MAESRVSSFPERVRAAAATLPSRFMVGRLTVDVGARQLRRGLDLVQLPARAFDVLVYLVTHRGRTVDKDEIIATVWRDVAVTDDSLIHAVSVLRRALGDDSAKPSFIETIPRRGYRFIGSVQTIDGVDSSGQMVAPDNLVAIPLSARPVTFQSPALLASIALLLVIAGASLYRTFEASTGDKTVRLHQSAPAGKTIVSGGVVSPTGRQLAFTARDNTTGRTALWIRALDAAEPYVVPGTDDAFGPFWAPDGRSLAFFARGKLMAVELSGGTPRSIAVIDGAPAGGSWGSSDVILYADWAKGLFAVDAAGGGPRRITRLDHAALDIAHISPQFLPDGRHFLYQVVTGDNSRAGIYAGRIDSPGSVRLLDSASAAAYVPPGFLLYVQRGMLLAEPFDASRLQLTGRPVMLARDVSTPLLPEGSVISGSSNLLAFREGVSEQRLAWIERSGIEQNVIDVPTRMFNFRVSPDERYLLATGSPTSAPGLWLVDLAHQQHTRLEADAIAPLWSPDAKRIAFTSRGGLDLHVRGVDGNGTKPLKSDPLVKILNDWTPDAQHLVYTQLDAESKLDLWVLPLNGGAARPLLTTPFNEAQARISPDGRWIAYTSDQSGLQDVYLRRYPQLDEPHVVSVGGGGQPVWRSDQSELYYLSPDGGLMAVDTTALGRSGFGAPRKLFRTPIAGRPSDARDSYAVTAEGQRFLIDGARSDTAASPITVLINWSAGLSLSPVATQTVMGQDRTVVATR